MSTYLSVNTNKMGGRASAKTFRLSEIATRKVWRQVIATLLMVLTPCFGAVAGSNQPPQDGNSPAKRERGFTYIHEEVRDVPWSIHVVKIDRSHKDLELHTVLGLGDVFGMSVVSTQAKFIPREWGRALAAINGDFFQSTAGYPGDPDGLQIVNGELVSGPNPTRICFWVDSSGNPHRSQVMSQFKVIWPDKTTTPIGLNEFRDVDAAVLYTKAIGSSSRTVGGMDLVLEKAGKDPWLPLRIGQTYTAKIQSVSPQGNAPISSNTMVLSLGARLRPLPAKIEPGLLVQVAMTAEPDLSCAMTGIGGGPTLVEEGKARHWDGEISRHPRTAVGWNKNYIFLVEVDGRQRSLSVGMTFDELTQYLMKLGCEEAINLDGGGSATMWVLGNVMNSPSQGQERPAANSLILVQKDKGRQ